MAPSNRVEITDRDGWRKIFPLEKPLLHIGSDARNDIVLETRRGGGVAPRHLQLIAVPGGTAGSGGAPAYRAINLSDRDIAVGEAQGRSLSPRAATEIADGETLRLGDFVLVFRLDTGPGVSRPASAALVADAGPAAAVRPARAEVGAVGVAETSSHIGLSLSLPRAMVYPDQPLDGIITVRNMGEESGVQFRLELEGLDPDCYEIGPGPILFPNVEKGVYLQLRHPRGPGLAAGRHTIQIHVSAPDAYPGERVSVSHEIEIVPYYHHTLSLVTVD
jgi:hypothetical protein